MPDVTLQGGKHRGQIFILDKGEKQSGGNHIMKKRALITIAASTFAVFGILLSIGISLSTKDEANDLRYEVSDLESRVNDVE